MPLRVLIIGADGTVGRGLIRHLTDQGHSITGTTRRRETAGGNRVVFDLAADPSSWPALPKVDAAVICAAVPGFAPCRKDPLATARVNVDAPGVLAEKFAGTKTHLIFLSSNAVFDGAVPFTPHDRPPCPLTEYGRQKARAEDVVLNSGADVTVLRLARVLSGATPVFSTWWESLKAGRNVSAFTDSYRAPVTVEYVSTLISKILEKRSLGIHHASGDEDISYFDITEIFTQTMAADPGLVTAMEAAAEAPGREDLSPHTTLSMERESIEFGLNAPSSRNSVEQAAQAFKKRQGP